MRGGFCYNVIMEQPTAHPPVVQSSTTAAPDAAPRVHVQKLVALGTWAIVLVLVLHFFDAVRFVFLGLLATATLVAALRPVVTRIPGPRGLAVLIVGVACVAVVAGLVAALWWFLSAPLAAQIEHWPELRGRLDTQLLAWSNRLQLEHPVTVHSLGDATTDFVRGGGGGEVLSRTTAGLTNAGIALAFLLFGSMFLLIEPRGKFLRPLMAMCHPRYRGGVERAVNDLEPGLRWWVIGTLVSMTVVGVISGVGYSAAGLEFALLLAILAGVLELIPTLGPILSWIAALLVASTQSTQMMLNVTVVYAIVQSLESFVILPLVMRGAVRIPPAVTLFSAVLWGKALGPGGLLLAIPIDLLLWAFARNLLMNDPPQVPEISDSEHAAQAIVPRAPPRWDAQSNPAGSRAAPVAEARSARRESAAQINPRRSPDSE